MIWIYKILSSVAAVFVLPGYALYIWITKKKTRNLKSHFGLVKKINKSPDQKTLWVYALSFGEVNAVIPVLKRLHHEHPNIVFVITVTTESGYDRAHEKLSFAQKIVFHPLDCWPFLNSFVEKIKPDLFILVDTGFWPGLLLTLKEAGIPKILLNGRMSSRSFRKFQKLENLVRPLFQSFDDIFMQNNYGIEAMKSLGVDPKKIQLMGDTKLDSLTTESELERIRFREELKITASHKVWVVGSTHSGEEEIILNAFQRLKKLHPDLILILAPRRLERIPILEGIIKEHSLNFILRTQLSKSSTHVKSIILIDTQGELSKIYSVGDIAFVGNSLIFPGGGHSLMEPVAQGISVLHGPYIENVQHTSKKLQELGIAQEVRNSEDIEKKIDDLLKNPFQKNQIHTQALAHFETQKGTSDKIAKSIIKYLDLKNN